MAKSAKRKYSKEQASKKIGDIRTRLQQISAELDDLHENIEGASLLDEIRVATTSLETKAAAFKLCSNPSTMSF